MVADHYLVNGRHWRYSFHCKIPAENTTGITSKGYWRDTHRPFYPCSSVRGSRGWVGHL